MTILLHLPRNSLKDYAGWLESLTPNMDEVVVLQRFRPYDDSSIAFGASFERWELTIGRYTGRSICGPGLNQPIRLDGIACWINSDAEWGDVFPARIVPYGQWEELKNVGDSAVSLNPVYEPLYIGKTRSLFLVPFGKTEKGLLEFKQKGLRHYYRTVDEGRLVTVFSSELPTMNNGAALMHSEFIG